MEDALGNKIIIGNWYGYSQNRNGLTKTVIGTVSAINKERLALKIQGVWESLYNDEMKPVLHGKTSSVSGHRLFPIDKNNIGFNG